MKTDKHTPLQPIFKAYEPPLADGDFDEIVRLAKEVLSVPFVYVSLTNIRSKTTDNGFQNGKSGITSAYTANISMSSQSYLSKKASSKNPDKLKIALAKFKGLHFCATLPINSSKGDRFGKLYVFTHSSQGWGDFHWDIMSAVAKIITHKVELQLKKHQSFISKSTNSDHEEMSVMN